ncbi:MAG: hypothetical protein WKG06_17475 [Segetibacter sp.]
MYAAAKEHRETEDDYELTDEEINELDRKREMRLSEQSKGYRWSDAKKMILNN